MNTPKKDDLIKEINEIVPQIGMEAVRFFKPVVMLISAVTRYAYLEQQLQRVIPKPTQKEEENEPIKETSSQTTD